MPAEALTQAETQEFLLFADKTITLIALAYLMGRVAGQEQAYMAAVADEVYGIIMEKWPDPTELGELQKKIRASVTPSHTTN